MIHSRVEITATSAAPVRRAYRLRKRAYRRADGRFLAEGPQAVREALATPGAVQEVFATGEFDRRYPQFRRDAEAAHISWHLASGAVLAHLSDTVTPQGIVAVCALPGTRLPEALAPHMGMGVLLAQVRDPGNVGTVIRVADAAGADGVVCSTGTADPWNTKAVRASAGSSFHLPVAADVALDDAIARARECGMAVLAADARGVGLFDEVELAGPTLWVLGNEAWGLPQELLDKCDAVVAIPIYGRAESLNLATAAAVCMYASAQARHRAGAVGDPH